MVHIVYDVNNGRFADYFPTNTAVATQVGFGQFYEGRRFQRGFGQHGRGVGGFLRTVWRFMVPIMKDIGSAAGKEGLSAGGRILGNIAQGAEAKDAIVTETQRAVRNVARKAADRLQEQEGSGARKRQSGNSASNQRGAGSNKRKRKRAPARSHTPASLVGRSVLVPQNSTKKKRVDSFGLY